MAKQENIQGVNYAGNVTEDGEKDVDAEVGSEASLEKDSDRWKEDCDDDLEDITRRYSVPSVWAVNVGPDPRDLMACATHGLPGVTVEWDGMKGV